MREIAIALALAVAGCGGGPVLANAPHPPTAAVAGGAAGIAAVLTAVDPDAATRKPEKKVDAPKQPIEVKETVPSDVLDRLEHRGSGAARAKTAPGPDAKKQPAGPPPKLPSPREAIDHDPRTP